MTGDQKINDIRNFWNDEEPFIKTTFIEGLIAVSRPYFKDDRGSFQEVCRIPDVEEILGEKIIIKQSQISTSQTGVLRGIHAENHFKIITPISGKYLQVFVDLRVASGTFKKWIAFNIDNSDFDKLTAFVVSPGIGNAFFVTEGPLIYHYATTSIYDPTQAGRGVKFNDPELSIDWPSEDPKISDRDKEMPTLKEFVHKFYNGE